MPYRILITNDDGVASAGLMAAYEAVKDLGEVFVVAPATQQSAVGRSMTLFEPLRVARLSFGDTTAYSVNGTPTDSVIIGMFVIMDRKPDLVISGINIGENLSAEAVTTSGTIGAALEAANQGVPSIAVSMSVEDEGDKFVDTGRLRDYAAARHVIRRLARCVLEGAMPPGADVLNVNIPGDATNDTPVVSTTLARRMYDTRVHRRQDPRGRSYYWIDGTVVEDAAEGTDLHVMLKKGHISVTPLTLDMTAKAAGAGLDDVLKRAFGK
ncbi:MAG TPA: 5'/3'-nucleotidase SurE [Methanocella sp.]|jgi:5'-nucleotidase